MCFFQIKYCIVQFLLTTTMVSGATSSKTTLLYRQFYGIMFYFALLTLVPYQDYLAGVLQRSLRQFSNCVTTATLNLLLNVVVMDS